MNATKGIVIVDNSGGQCACSDADVAKLEAAGWLVVQKKAGLNVQIWPYPEYILNPQA